MNADELSETVHSKKSFIVIIMQSEKLFGITFFFI